MQNKQKK